MPIPTCRPTWSDRSTRWPPRILIISHTVEGPDDMPAHVKSVLIGSSVSVPVQEGRLALGTWQGIYLCEHRNRGGGRRLVLTLQGEPPEG